MEELFMVEGLSILVEEVVALVAVAVVLEVVALVVAALAVVVLEENGNFNINLIKSNFCFHFKIFPLNSQMQPA